MNDSQGPQPAQTRAARIVAFSTWEPAAFQQQQQRQQHNYQSNFAVVLDAGQHDDVDRGVRGWQGESLIMHACAVSILCISRHQSFRLPSCQEAQGRVSMSTVLPQAWDVVLVPD